MIRFALAALLLALVGPAAAQNFGNINPDTVIGNPSPTAKGPAVPFPASVFPRQVNTNADLTASSTSTYPNGVWRIDFATGRGAAPVFYRPAAIACPLNSGAGDNGSQVRSVNGGCWLAQWPADRSISFLQFGGIGDGTTNDAVAVQAALSAAGAICGNVYYTREYNVFSAKIVVPRCVKLIGPHARPPMSVDGSYANLPGSIIGNGNPVLQITAGGMVTQSVVRCSNLTNPNSADPKTLLQNLYSIVTGMPSCGVGIRLGDGTKDGGSAGLATRNLVVGFDQCILSANNNRYEISFNEGDCVNGTKEVDVGEVGINAFNHFWPYLIAGGTGNTFEDQYFYAPLIATVAGSAGKCQFTISVVEFLIPEGGIDGLIRNKGKVIRWKSVPGGNWFAPGNSVMVQGSTPSSCDNNGTRQTVTAVSGPTVTTDAPFTGSGTVASAGNIYAQVVPRAGKAFWLDRNTLPTSGCDHCTLTEPRAFGWDVGVLVNDSSNVQIVAPRLDTWNQPQNTTTKGVSIQGESSLSKLTSPRISGFSIEYDLNQTGGFVPGHTIEAPSFFGCIKNSIVQRSGVLSVTGGVWDSTQHLPDPGAFYNANCAIQIMSTAEHFGLGGSAYITNSAINYQTPPITAAVSGTGGTCRLTSVKHGLSNLAQVTVSGIAGATGCNVTGQVRFVDPDKFEILATTFGGTYTGGGVGIVSQTPVRTIKVADAYVNPPDLGQNHVHPMSFMSEAFSGYLPGPLTVANQVIHAQAVTKPLWVMPDSPGSVFRLGVPCTAAKTFTVLKSGAAFGTVNVPAGGTAPVLATFTFAGGQFDSGDTFTLIGPATPDATCGQISWSIRTQP